MSDDQENTMDATAAGQTTAKPRRKRKPATPTNGYVVMRRFKYAGREVLPGEAPPVEMFSHPRFESFVSTGLVRMVRS